MPALNFKSIVNEGMFGKFGIMTKIIIGAGLGQQQRQKSARGREHIMKVRLDLELPGSGYRLCDSFTWDIGNPENCPMDFAKVLLSEEEEALNNPQNVAVVAQEIESQIVAYCSKLSLNLHRTVEALEVEDSDSQDEDEVSSTELN